MWLDAKDMQNFYSTSLGLTARRMISMHVREMWPDVKDMNVLGIGFTTPYLDAFKDQSSFVLASMPASQGVLNWPVEGPNQTCLTVESELPFPDLSIDRVLMVHAIECTESIRPMMREIWRVLTGTGRLLVIAPNRRGVWSRLERTPFGNGRPYTSSQLCQLLKDTLFTPICSNSALYVPPSQSRMILSSALAWEQIGKRWLAALGGVVSVEAGKQVYATTPIGKGARQQIYATVNE